jgi:hypothetical protein
MKGSGVVDTERGSPDDCGFSWTERRDDIENLEIFRLFSVISIDFSDRLLVRVSAPEFRHCERDKSGETVWRFGERLCGTLCGDGSKGGKLF